MSTLKEELGEMLKLGFLGDSFICAFLDKSGIHKKPDYQKEIAEQLKRLNKLREQQLKQLEK